MDIQHALAGARGDAARLLRYMDRIERFLDALDWSLLSLTQARESAMLDDLLAGDAAEAILYTEWLEEQVAAGVKGVVGALRFYPAPRPSQPDWITLAA